MPAEAATVSATELRTQRINAALGRYRVIAYTVGCGLLLLCVATVLDWGFHHPQMAEIVGPLHGFLYMIYLAIAIDLALRARWSIGGTLLVLVSGTIPFLSFVAERQVTRRVREGRSL
jgi:integral membrane protein